MPTLTLGTGLHLENPGSMGAGQRRFGVHMGNPGPMSRVPGGPRRHPAVNRRRHHEKETIR